MKSANVNVRLNRALRQTFEAAGYPITSDNLTVRVTPALYRALEEAAKAGGRSQRLTASAIVEHKLEDWLRENGYLEDDSGETTQTGGG